MDIDAETLFVHLGKRYEDVFAESPNMQAFIQQAATKLPPHRKVLDAGSGTGKPVAHILSSAGHSVHGIGVSKEMVRIASSQVQGTFQIADMREFKPRTILNVFQVFEVATSRWNFSDWSAPTEQCIYDPTWSCARQIKKPWMSHYTKETFFSEEGWRRLLADAGFAVEEDSSWLFSGKDSEACEVQHLFRTRKVEKVSTAESFMNYLKVKDMETIAELMEPNSSILTLGVPNNGVQGLGSKTEEFDGPVEDLPFSTGSFDAVLSAWKLDSASSLEKPVGELVRVVDTSSRQAQVVLLQGAPDSEVLKLLRGIAPAPFLNHQGSLLHSASNILADHSFGNLSFRRPRTF
ncbi:uncharacterized protein BDW43DRAFT_312006 [Aspergillus alliaceus]|uniref:uncharacterized protein n=1 Tax=Petromyces alliaceus TaxID=209559 RepID=UPI0012A672A6|nr:uncharacterized protein BDW43DRAFT_312006 [Aspergillus alliaceus]KAB8232622.1 hypothetical protein BDW43DRAFT_312006 [Aspergillus alliaceus]